MESHKSYILANVCKVMADVDSFPVSELDVKHKEFKDKFPKVYQNCILSSSSQTNKNEFLKKLYEMLKVRDQVISGEKTEVQANVEVSEKVAKEYLYPVVGEPSEKQKEKALARILKTHENDMKDYDPTKKYE